MDTEAKAVKIAEKIAGIVDGWLDEDGDDDVDVAKRVAMSLPVGMPEREELRLLVDVADRILGRIHDVLYDLHRRSCNPARRATLTKRIASELRRQEEEE